MPSPLEEHLSDQIGNVPGARGSHPPSKDEITKQVIKRCGSESVKLLNDARPSPVTAKTNEVVLNSLPPEAEITVLNASAPGDLAALYPVLRAARQDGVDEIKRGAYPALDQRHEFARDVAPWMAGAGRGAEPLRAPLPLTDP